MTCTVKIGVVRYVDCKRIKYIQKCNISIKLLFLVPSTESTVSEAFVEATSSQLSADLAVKRELITEETTVKLELNTLVSKELNNLTVSQEETMLISDINLPVASSPKSANLDINKETSPIPESPTALQARNTTCPSEVVMVDEETRMSADISSRAQTPAKQVKCTLC